MVENLVGAKVEYRVSGEVVQESFDSTKKEIVSLTKKAHLIGGKPCIVLLGEMYNYHRASTHFLVVRSSFNNGRKAGVIKEYLELPIKDRVDMIKTSISTRVSEERELWVEAARFISRFVPKYRNEFKDVMSREEFKHIF